MANKQQSFSVTISTDQATPSPLQVTDTKFSAPSFTSPTSWSPPPGPAFPPPPLAQLNQAPSPSTRPPRLLSPANEIRTGSPVPHMSTPPGPPVFSSPLQPAAVPYKTSPATPQPIAYSSGSSFPSSSTPHFSNGSVELQHQISDATEERDMESPNVLFSAHKVQLYVRAS